MALCVGWLVLSFHFIYLLFPLVTDPVAGNAGALDRGVPMSHVDFKKRQCRVSLLIIFLNVTCRI